MCATTITPLLGRAPLLPAREQANKKFGRGRSLQDMAAGWFFFLFTFPALAAQPDMPSPASAHNPDIPTGYLSQQAGQTSQTQTDTAVSNPADSRIAPGLRREQPDRRTLHNSGENYQYSDTWKAAPGYSSAETDQRGQEAQTQDGETEQVVPPSPPIPPYPNYPESNLPSPPRAPRQQEYLHLNHIYFEPLALAIGGYISMGWLAMISSGKAFRLGIDIYNAGTNLSVMTQGQGNNPDYQVTGIQLRTGFHFFADQTQLKGFEVGIDLRTGIVVSPASGSRVVVQANLELPFSYRFVLNLYSGAGRQSLGVGIAPYITLVAGGYLATAGTISTLRDSDKGFDEYIINGNLFLAPNFVNNLGSFALKFGVRFGIDVSIVF